MQRGLYVTFLCINIENCLSKSEINVLLPASIIPHGILSIDEYMKANVNSPVKSSFLI